MVLYSRYPSPVGTLLLISDGESLTGLSWDHNLPDNARVGDCPVLQKTGKWLDAYFSGDRPDMVLPLAPVGTDFQKRVWMRLLSIPWGQTVTYGQLARDIAGQMQKDHMSPQAVGQAVSRNPIAILIPCHRVVGCGEKLTGYAWGIEKKKWLLNHEKRNTAVKENGTCDM